MGGGTWTKSSYCDYVKTSYNCSVDTSGTITSALNNSDIFKAHKVNQSLDPKGVIRECRDSEEHPNTIPIILALDVTGSMGSAATEVAKQLNKIMTNLYEKLTDVEFMFMGIGDLDYDSCPIQATQFESDIRIVEQLDKVYFEFGGGGNAFESYTAAWYFGSRHTDLDCWKRGKKGIIITLGDEEPNPHLPIKGNRGGVGLNECLGDSEQENIQTIDLYKEVSKKFDVYHIHVDHSSYRTNSLGDTWTKLLGDHFKSATLQELPDVISDIIIAATTEMSTETQTNADGDIVW